MTTRFQQGTAGGVLTVTALPADDKPPLAIFEMQDGAKVEVEGDLTKGISAPKGPAKFVGWRMKSFGNQPLTIAVDQ